MVGPEMGGPETVRYGQGDKFGRTTVIKREFIYLKKKKKILIFFLTYKYNILILIELIRKWEWE